VQYVLETSWITYAVLQSMPSLLFLQVSGTPAELVILCYIEYLLISNLIATLFFIYVASIDAFARIMQHMKL